VRVHVNILSLDWDTFFHDRANDPEQWNLYDWGHCESRSFIEEAWEVRAAGFLSHDMPLPGTTGEEDDFWTRFRIKRTGKLVYCESHALMSMPRKTLGLRSVAGGVLWTYDAHHDLGYGNYRSEADDQERTLETEVGDRWNCENWGLLWYLGGAEIHVRYPTWRDPDDEVKPFVNVDIQVDAVDNRPSVEFDRVFVCRSGAWTPSWLDESFFAFVERAPIDCKINLDGVTPRTLDLTLAEHIATECLRLRAEGPPVIPQARALDRSGGGC
jgi:hypothetical protein